MSVHDNLQLDHQLCFALYAATHAVTRAYRPELDALGLTYPQYLVLLALWDGGESSLTRLSRRLGLDPPTLTPLVKRLAQAGLVSRERDSDDDRVLCIRTTPQADALREPLAEVQNGVVCATGLAPAEFETLRRSLHRLTATMTAARRAGRPEQAADVAAVPA